MYWIDPWSADSTPADGRLVRWATQYRKPGTNGLGFLFVVQTVLIFVLFYRWSVGGRAFIIRLKVVFVNGLRKLNAASIVGWRSYVWWIWLCMPCEPPSATPFSLCMWFDAFSFWLIRSAFNCIFARHDLCAILERKASQLISLIRLGGLASLEHGNSLKLEKVPKVLW